MSLPATPFMGLVLPTPSVDTGPTWASLLNTALSSKIDPHNHTSGQGALIPSAAININADLSFGNFNLTGLKAARFTNLSATPTAVTDVNELVDSGGNLYWMNSAGQAVQITSGSTLSATSLGGISGLPSGTASAAFGSQTFTWRSATNVAATMDVGPVLIRDTAASALAITIASPAGIASAYSLTLPGALPSSSGILSISTSGALSAFGVVSGTSLTISGSLTASGNSNTPVLGHALGSLVATATGGALGLVGNLQGAAATADVVINTQATRTAGMLAQIQNNSTGKLDIDYQGLLRLTSQAAPIQPSSIVTAITPNASITAGNGAGYWKDAAGIVHLRGSLQNNSGGPSSSFVTTTPLPAGFRPANTRIFACSDTITTAYAVQVSSAGAINTSSVIASGLTIYLDTISFLAEA